MGNFILYYTLDVFKETGFFFKKRVNQFSFYKTLVSSLLSVHVELYLKMLPFYINNVHPVKYVLLVCEKNVFHRKSCFKM